MGQIITQAMLTELKQRDQSVMIVDVRRAEDYQEGHIEGAVNFPKDNIQAHINELPRDKKIILYCYRGNSSQKVMELLENKGFKNVYSLEGGYTQYNSMGLN